MDAKTINEITRQIYVIVAGIIILIGLIGNFLVVLYFLVKDKHRTAYKTFLMILGIVDFIACLGFLSQWLDRATKMSTFGLLACTLMPLRVICVCISSSLLLGMSFERYYGITKPFSPKKVEVKHVYIYLFIAIIFWFAYCTPSFLEAKFQNGNCRYIYTYISRDVMNSILIGREVLKFAVVVMIMIYFYFHIKKALRCQQQNFSNPAIAKRNESALRTLKVLIILFIICIGVASVESIAYFVISLTRSSGFGAWSYAYTNIVYCFFYLNSSVNCLIYTRYIDEFRRFVLGLLRINKSSNLNESEGPSERNSSQLSLA